MGKHLATVCGAVVAALVAWAVTTWLGLFDPWWVRVVLAVALGAVLEVVAVAILSRQAKAKTELSIGNNVKSRGDLKVSRVKARTAGESQTRIANDLTAKGSVEISDVESENR
jgi:ABC-type transport system involved in cytochrome bd biosynthesis fused ATPase/permease subunit